MITITGATGHLGRATIQALLTKVDATQLIALAHESEKANDLRQLGVEVRSGDYEDAASLVAAFQGTDTLLFISTPETDFELRMRQHRNVIDAAKLAGVQHLVYTSGLNPTRKAQFTASLGHLATETYLRSSGLSYTIVRNTLYLDLVPLFIGQGTLPSGRLLAAAGAGRVSYALREEIGQALANVLTTRGHENQTYDIDPAPTYSMLDVAATLSEVTGRPVAYVPVSTQELMAGMRRRSDSVQTSSGSRN